MMTQIRIITLYIAPSINVKVKSRVEKTSMLNAKSTIKASPNQGQSFEVGKKRRGRDVKGEQMKRYLEGSKCIFFPLSFKFLIGTSVTKDRLTK